MKKENDKKTKIMLIPPYILPIPSVKGGGIETQITNLINVNEVEKRVIFIIPSIFDNDAINHKYNYSKIYYIKRKKVINSPKPIILADFYLHNFIIFIRKCFNNRYTRKVFRFLKKSPDYHNLYLWICYRLCKLEKIDYVVNESTFININSFKKIVHTVGIDNVYYRVHCSTPVGTKEERMVIRNSILLSRIGLNRWISGYDIKGDNQVVYNGIDLSLFNKQIDIHKTEWIKHKYEIKNNDIIILYCGRIDKDKGVEQLISAFNLINDNNIKLMIIGSVLYGLDVKNTFWDKIISLASKNKNIILTNYIPNDELYNYYRLASIQVIPTIIDECAPLASIEGMAMGLPLIVTDSGGMVEYVDDECATIIKRDSDLVIKLAKEMLVLAYDKEKRKSMSLHGIRRAQLFSRENNYSNFIKVFK